jgi:type IV pilus assembly protein PilM
MLESFTDMLKGQIGSLGGIGAKRSQSVLGIDIGSSAIKIVQLRRERGTAILETYGELSLGPYADLDIGRATNLPNEKISEALTDIMREANTTTVSCGASIPFSASLVSLVSMPPLPTSKLNAMIPIEARKYIPVPISEVQLDWFILPEGEARLFSGQQDDSEAQKQAYVLLVAIHNQTLSRYGDALKNAKLSPSFYEIEVFSSIRAAMERSVAPVALLDIGAATSKLYIVEYGVVRGSHVISKGSQDITLALANANRISIARAEELKRQSGLLGRGTDGDAGVSHIAVLTLEFIFTEARRVLLNFQKKNNRAVGKLILTGGGATMKGILDFAKEQFDMELELGDPFSRTQAPAFLEGVLKEAGPEFTVAVGLALRKLQEFA